MSSLVHKYIKALSEEQYNYELFGKLYHDMSEKEVRYIEELIAIIYRQKYILCA